LLVGAVLLLAPAPIRLESVAALLLAGAALCLAVGVRWLTFERYLL
jgi:hypothetical protein